MWQAALMAGAGKALELGAGFGAAKAQEREARLLQQRNEAVRQQGDAELNRLLGDLAMQTPEQDRRQMYGNFVGGLMASRPAANRAFTGVPAASARYREDVGTAAGQGDARSRLLASLAARTDAPSRMRQRQGEQTGRVAAILARLRGQAEGDARVTKQKMEGIQANPWVTLLGQGLQEGAKWMSSGKSGGGK